MASMSEIELQDNLKKDHIYPSIPTGTITYYGETNPINKDQSINSFYTIPSANCQKKQPHPTALNTPIGSFANSPPTNKLSNTLTPKTNDQIHH